MKQCGFCGKEFEPNKPKAKFCSADHRVKAHRMRHLKLGLKRGRPFKMAGDKPKKEEPIQPKVEQKVMPKGLTLEQRIKWLDENESKP